MTTNYQSITKSFICPWLVFPASSDLQSKSFTKRIFNPLFIIPITFIKANVLKGVNIIRITKAHCS